MVAGKQKKRKETRRAREGLSIKTSRGIYPAPPTPPPPPAAVAPSSPSSDGGGGGGGGSGGGRGSGDDGIAAEAAEAQVHRETYICPAAAAGGREQRREERRRLSNTNDMRRTPLQFCHQPTTSSCNVVDSSQKACQFKSAAAASDHYSCPLFSVASPLCAQRRVRGGSTVHVYVLAAVPTPCERGPRRDDRPRTASHPFPLSSTPSRCYCYHCRCHRRAYLLCRPFLGGGGGGVGRRAQRGCCLFGPAAPSPLSPVGGGGVCSSSPPAVGTVSVRRTATGAAVGRASAVFGDRLWPGWGLRQAGAAWGRLGVSPGRCGGRRLRWRRHHGGTRHAWRCRVCAATGRSRAGRRPCW